MRAVIGGKGQGVVVTGDRTIGRGEPAAVLGVVPARGGSKRIAGKNIRPLCGEPLLAYTVEAALSAGVFGRVVVSTDSEAIADVALACGADVPFLREQRLADDHAPVSAVSLDVLERLDPEGSRFHCVGQLMPNCPLRTADDVRASYRQFVRTQAGSQLSVSRFGWLNPWWAMRLEASGRLTPLHSDGLTKRSQDLPEAYCPTGAIWWAKADVLRREGTFYAAGYRGWKLAWQRAVDIDNEDDWELAELLMQARQARVG